MTKTINKLENERINSIKNLNPKELAIYIDDLNKKFFESFENKDAQDMEYYQEKLNEISDLLGKQYDVDDYISNSKVCFLTSKFMINELDAQTKNNLSIAYMIYEKAFDLYELKKMLDNIMMTYYHNYVNHECRDAIDSLILKLEDDNEFDNDSLLEYGDRLHDRCRYNISLMKDLDNNIKYVRDRMLKLIDDLDEILEYVNVSSELIQDYIDEYDNIKDNVLKNAKDNPIVKHNKENNYLDKYIDMIESLRFTLNSIEFYKLVKDNVLDVIDGDAFLMIKEIEYKLIFEDDDLHDYVPSKEDFFENSPCYEVRNLKFIKPKRDN